MISFIVSIIVLILFFVFIVALKAMIRGIKAKKNLNKNPQNNKSETKK